MNQPAGYTLTKTDFRPCYNKSCNRYALGPYLHCCMRCFHSNNKHAKHDDYCNFYSAPHFGVAELYKCQNIRCDRHTNYVGTFCCDRCKSHYTSILPIYNDSIPKHMDSCHYPVSERLNMRTTLESKFFTVVFGSNDTQYVTFDNIEIATKFFDMATSAVIKNYTSVTLNAWTGDVSDLSSICLTIKTWTAN